MKTYVANRATELEQSTDEVLYEQPPGRARRRVSGAAAAPPPAQRVRSFICSTPDLTQIEAIIGRPTTQAEVRAAVAAAATQAVTLGTSGASALRASPRAAATRSFFQEAFGVPVEFIPAWRPTSATWRDMGELIAIRLRNAATILDGGWIRYFCWGDPAHCPECPQSPPGYFACSSFGLRHVICIGAAFWRAFGSGDTATMASTLLHEALHIYFGTTIADSGRSGNANCYERFVIRINGLFLHPATAANCPPAAPAPGNRPTVARGTRGPAVRELQVRLNAWSAARPASRVPQLTVDSIFGPRTEASARGFQRAAGLIVDGIVGPQTWGRLILETPAVAGESEIGPRARLRRDTSQDRVRQAYTARRGASRGMLVAASQDGSGGLPRAGAPARRSGTNGSGGRHDPHQMLRLANEEINVARTLLSAATPIGNANALRLVSIVRGRLGAVAGSVQYSRVPAVSGARRHAMSALSNWSDSNQRDMDLGNVQAYILQALNR